MFDEFQLRQYISDVMETNTLESEISKIQELMIGNTKHPDKLNPDKIKTLNQLFKMLLRQRDLLHATTKVHECIQCKQKENSSENV
jgi:hypothetical protein